MFDGGDKLSMPSMVGKVVDSRCECMTKTIGINPSISFPKTVIFTAPVSIISSCSS